MANPLLELQPNKVSRDIGSYVTYIYGEPKCGKSRFAAEFPDALFLASEPTQKAIPGIKIMDVTSWAEFKKMIRFLDDKQVKEIYKTVVLDTIDLYATFAERYVCNQAGVEDVKDIPYGAGYGRVEREFEQALRKIINMQYGLVLISHVTQSTFTREDGSEYNKLTPAVSSKRCKAVAENLADIYGFIHTVDGHRILTLRAPDGSISGGNHFKHLVPEVPLSYEALTKAVTEAIDKDEEEIGNPEFFTDERIELPQEPKYDFNELMAEFKTLVGQIQKNVTKEEFKNKWAPKITEVTEKYLGVGKKVNDCTAMQSEQLVLIVDDLKAIVGEGL